MERERLRMITDVSFPLLAHKGAGVEVTTWKSVEHFQPKVNRRQEAPAKTCLDL